MRYPAACLAVMLGLGVVSHLRSDEPKTGDHAKLMAEMQRQGHVDAWQRYPLLGIPLMQEAPAIDGTVDKREWSRAAALGYVLHMQEAAVVQDRVVWYLGYTATHFYMAFQIERPENARLPTRQDFWEILLDMDHAHGRTGNLAAWLEGELWHGKVPNLVRTEWEPKWEYRARATETGWEGEMALPFDQCPGYTGAPAPGTVWGFDLVRNEHTPTDRLAHVSWRPQWHAMKDLGHLCFTGRPVAIRLERVGWIPEHKQMGIKLAISNFGDTPVSFGTRLELRQATGKLIQNYLGALGSALTEDLDAAIGASIRDEVERALVGYRLAKEENGALEVPAQTSKLIDFTLPDSPGDYVGGFVLTDGDQPIAGAMLPFVVKVPLAIELQSYLYSAGAIAYKVDLSRLADKLTPASTLRLEVKHGDRILATVDHAAIVNRKDVQGRLAVAPVPGETLQAVATIRDGDQVVATNSEPLMVAPKADWIGNRIGRSDLVPPPYVPLQATADAARTLTVDYRWPGNAIFPGIAVKGREILAAPLELALAAADGTPVPLDVTAWKLASHDAQQAVYTFAATAGALGSLTGQVRLEFDGFAWYTLTLTPATPGVELGGLTFTAALKPEFGRLFTRGRTGADGTSTIPGNDSGIIPEEGLVLPYTFQVWAGYVEGGLQWYAENPRNWSNRKSKEAIGLTRTAERTTLTVKMVDKPLALREPTTWEFGFIPTPSKERRQGYAEESYFQIGGIPSLEAPPAELKQENPGQYAERSRLHELVSTVWQREGVKAVILFSSWNDPLFGYPGVASEEQGRQLRTFVEAMHGQGIKVLVYAGWGISTKCPEWERYGTELVNLPLKNSGYATYWISPVSLFADLYVYRLAELVRESGIDGVYMDSTLGINYSEHPNGMLWTDAGGKELGSYPVRAMRDFARRIYKVLNGEVIERGIFYNHHSPPANVAVENFVNVRCPSEYAQKYQGELDSDFIDFFIAKNGGIQYGYHTELTNKNWMGKWVSKYLVQLDSVAVPLGVSFKAVTYAPWIPYRDYSQQSQPIWPIAQAMGWVDSFTAEYHPFWRGQSFVTVEPADRTLVTVWLQAGRKALVCVSNLAPDDRTLKVTFNPGAFGMPALAIEDAITGQLLPLEANAASVPMEFERFRLWKVTPP